MDSQGTAHYRGHVTCPSSHADTDMQLFGDDVSPFDAGIDSPAMFAPIYSPSVPTLYDSTMHMSSSVSASMGTVSPHDLMVRDTTFSAPNSNALTNLTSPSMYNESPGYHDSFDASPLFDPQDNEHSTDPWFPLFPQENSAEQTPANESPLATVEEVEVGAIRSARRSNAQSPTGRHSSVAGVSARKRDKPLPPIVVEDPNDTVAIKRARNTLAARKSREKKMERFEELENKIAALEADRDRWKALALARSS